MHVQAVYARYGEAAALSFALAVLYRLFQEVRGLGLQGLDCILAAYTTLGWTCPTVCMAACTLWAFC